jgi:hypothetical protein
MTSSQEPPESLHLQFAEARKEIMALRLDNQKLESVIRALQEPMVVSSESESDSPRRKRSRAALVVALPQGEAQERIETLMRENQKLAEEVATILSAPSGALFQRIKELETIERELRDLLKEKERSHNAIIDSMSIRHEKLVEKIEADFELVTSKLEEMRNQTATLRDSHSAEIHDMNKTIASERKSNEILTAENDHLRAISMQILANAKLARVETLE